MAASERPKSEIIETSLRGVNIRAIFESKLMLLDGKVFYRDGDRQMAFNETLTEVLNGVFYSFRDEGVVMDLDDVVGVAKLLAGVLGFDSNFPPQLFDEFRRMFLELRLFEDDSKLTAFEQIERLALDCVVETLRGGSASDLAGQLPNRILGGARRIGVGMSEEADLIAVSNLSWKRFSFFTRCFINSRDANEYLAIKFMQKVGAMGINLESALVDKDKFKADTRHILEGYESLIQCHEAMFRAVFRVIGVPGSADDNADLIGLFQEQYLAISTSNMIDLAGAGLSKIIVGES